MFLAPKDGAIWRLLQRYPRDDVDLMGRSMEQARNVVAPVRATEPPNLHSRRRAEAGSDVERQLVAVEADGQHLTEQIKENRAAGLDDYHAVIEATVQRTRPVILTALAAVLAFIPLTNSLLGSMACILLGGTAIGTDPAFSSRALPRGSGSSRLRMRAPRVRRKNRSCEPQWLRSRASRGVDFGSQDRFATLHGQGDGQGTTGGAMCSSVP